jgi:hypothetical protein
MLRRTLALCPRHDRGYDEVKYVGRRLQLFPTINPYLCRREIFLDRFREVGPETSRVWLSLGPKMRRRRAGRDRDMTDKRFYWRPIPAGVQRRYLRDFRRLGIWAKDIRPFGLFPSNREIGLRTCQPIFDGKIEHKYGAEFAPDAPFDWEYRVY